MKVANVAVCSCTGCPQFFLDGWLFEGTKYCASLGSSIEGNPEKSISENCPLEDSIETNKQEGDKAFASLRLAIGTLPDSGLQRVMQDDLKRLKEQWESFPHQKEQK